uniref:FATC domain-containing protein n=1 Tax=Arcella intermedia TaxID=1963864 RepID=A0A6B2LYN4_9EUKA
MHSTAASVSTRNIHAVNIVKRVKEKLEGYDGTNEPMSIAQQVDWVIKESTSTDNLCKMYEGWTSWI